MIVFRYTIGEYMLDVNRIDKYLLIQGNCFDKLKEIPDKSIDLILTDPPYNLANYSTGNMRFEWRSDINNDIAKWDETILNPYDLVLDGKVMDDNLTKIGRDYNWLKKETEKFNMKPEEALVITFDGKGQIFCQRKENNRKK